MRSTESVKETKSNHRNPLFAPEPHQVKELVANHPFATVVSVCGSKVYATPIPLVLQEDPSGTWLIGHFAKSNPQVAALRSQASALAIFTGDHSYISPSWLRDRTQAPTWYQISAQFSIEVEFEEGADATAASLHCLVQAMEKGRSNSWHASEMGSRFDLLARAVVSFRARVVAVEGKFKLGQNERQDVHEDIVSALRHRGDDALAQSMLEMRAFRHRYSKTAENQAAINTSPDVPR